MPGNNKTFLRMTGDFVTWLAMGPFPHSLKRLSKRFCAHRCWSRGCGHELCLYWAGWVTRTYKVLCTYPCTLPHFLLTAWCAYSPSKLVSAVLCLPESEPKHGKLEVPGSVNPLGISPYQQLTGTGHINTPAQLGSHADDSEM